MKLTSWNLPHPSSPNTETLRRRAEIHRDTSVEYEKDHLHLPRIFDALRASRRKIDHTRTEEREGEGLCESEIGATDISHLDGGGGVGNVYVTVNALL